MDWLKRLFGRLFGGPEEPSSAPEHFRQGGGFLSGFLGRRRRPRPPGGNPPVFRPTTTPPYRPPQPPTTSPWPWPVPTTPPYQPPPVSTTQPPYQPPPLERARLSLLQGINSARTQARMRPLAGDPQLDRSAQGHSSLMASRTNMSHQLPGEGDLMSRVQATGYPAVGVGECIAAGQRDAASTVSAWLGDPPHRAILLDPLWSDAGFGMAVGSDGWPYWTADFARRSSALYQVDNPPDPILGGGIGG